MTNITEQKPINSGFNAASTTTDVIKGIDLTGKTAIVTGGYAGLGLETVKTLVKAGAAVIVPVRDKAKATLNLQGIQNVTIEVMDLMDATSIDTFASKFLATHDALHILVNNAGIMWVPLIRDSRGYESQLSTNHLGHFQLTARLWPALKNANGARVINVSSWGHHYSSFVFEDANFEHRAYETLHGYGQSKTANILFTCELDKRGKTAGVRSFSLHPGAIVDTDIKRLLAPEKLIEMGIYDKDGNTIYDAEKGLKTIAQGASTIVWCATSPTLNDMGGVYCENNEIAVIDTSEDDHKGRNSLDLRGVMPYAIDKENAAKLWTLSEEMTGIKFDI
ncbi:NAD(P)-dependent dehydrogenase, short-chain alcohol dehydrogenase family [Chitinophaga sp. YR627]|uniref:SDR family NAD(P)-dependent oxidoreductase n=1 Tax=Chitinophaga sp. YR627 TaxID=1881041 RepID=UPI0008EB4F6E|nr:SDR family NAD(P)-dependent oxidoreductase [Chitinophaga sp. YR627]SFO69594.1 NAD(P)-dependent dehydrogenase, short-chain alcohol dehydrogenase family [Chitinophaga sp. YR627]